MNFFESSTQYSAEFNDIWTNFPDAKKGLACPFFAIITAYKFFKDGLVDKDAHEFAISASVTYSAFVGTNTELNFNQVINLTSLKQSDIMATTTELVETNILGFPEMLPAEKPTDSKRFVTIFLKNAKYFVVMTDKNGYYVRDCHESIQYNFETFVELVNHCSSVYQFTEAINITGISYSDYSSIEYIRIFESFKTEILSLLGMDSIQKHLHKMEIEGVSGFIDLDPSIPEHVDKGYDSIFDIPVPPPVSEPFVACSEFVDFE